MAISLTPVINRLKRTARDTTNFARSVTMLVQDIRRIDNTTFQRRLERVQSEFIALSKEWMELNRQIDILKSRSAEMSEGEIASLAEQAADNVMITENVGNVTALSYVSWAESTLILPAELLEYAVAELKSYPEGPEQLARLKAAIEKVE